MESIIPAIDLGIDFSKVKNIYLAQMPADLRKGIDGYVSLVQGPLALDPLDGSSFSSLIDRRTRSKVSFVTEMDSGLFISDSPDLPFSGLSALTSPTSCELTVRSWLLCFPVCRLFPSRHFCHELISMFKPI
ncbi:IS66 family insertion sequence element accessory protein TnpB [Allobaculum sp. Allo2]|nr:IS66 family insertion sequence element accessory protein TnpB [Allobaculum sp. Allo2]